MIYRSNQAFEGVLKEAYRLLTDRNSSNISPFKIEQYFEENDVLKARVLRLFTNYRTEWRNKSTHDYNLYFTDQEAFLAIVSISAFINILFAQMLEKLAYDHEIAELHGKGTMVDIELEKLDFIERIKQILILFAKELRAGEQTVLQGGTEGFAVAGALAGFFSKFAEGITVRQEYPITTGNERSIGGTRRYYADFLLEFEGEQLIIELKLSKDAKNVTRLIRDGSQQLLTYMSTAAINKGIVFIPLMVENHEVLVNDVQYNVGSKVYEIVQIYADDKTATLQ